MEVIVWELSKEPLKATYKAVIQSVRECQTKKPKEFDIRIECLSGTEKKVVIYHFVKQIGNAHDRNTAQSELDEMKKKQRSGPEIDAKKKQIARLQELEILGHYTFVAHTVGSTTYKLNGYNYPQNNLPYVVNAFYKAPTPTKENGSKTMDKNLATIVVVIAEAAKSEPVYKYCKNHIHGGIDFNEIAQYVTSYDQTRRRAFMEGRLSVPHEVANIPLLELDY